MNSDYILVGIIGELIIVAILTAMALYVGTHMKKSSKRS